jgi:hypothetical protein
MESIGGLRLNEISHDEVDVVLQPFDKTNETQQRRLCNQTLRRAEATVELEQLCIEAEKLESLSLRDLGSQFGIRHLILLTALAAFAATLAKQFGAIGALTSVPLAVILGFWLFIKDWQRRHADKIASRHRQFAHRHGDVTTTDIDIEQRWGAAADRVRRSGDYTLLVFLATVLVLFAAHWQAGSTALAGMIVSCVVVMIVLHSVMGPRRSGRATVATRHDLGREFDSLK